MMKNIKWLFFDLGSTLVDESRAYDRRFREIAEKTGVPYSVVRSMSIESYQRGERWDKEVMRKAGLELPLWHSEDEVLYFDTLNMLKELSIRYKLGIIANQEAGLDKRLEAFGILKYFSMVVSSSDVGFSKPDERIFAFALEKSGCLPSETVMIGDRLDNDIIPAKHVGMHTVWIRQGIFCSSSKREMDLPEQELHSLMELKEIF